MWVLKKNIMFCNVKELTTEELQKELQAIELFEQEIGKVNVENMLNKSIDTSFLGPMKCVKYFLKEYQ